QAEDGIRDFHVTGVQTCALPISGLARQTVRHNVTINNLLPGVFATDAQRHHIEGMLEPGGQTFEQLWTERGANNPAGRYGEPEEIGRASCRERGEIAEVAVA